MNTNMNQSQELSSTKTNNLHGYFIEECQESDEKDEFITDLEEMQEYLFEEFDNADNEINNLRKELAETKSALHHLQMKYDKKNRENKWFINTLLKRNVEANQKLFETMKKISFEAEMALAFQHIVIPPVLKRQSKHDFEDYQAAAYSTMDNTTDANNTFYDEESYQTPKSTHVRRLWTNRGRGEEDNDRLDVVADDANQHDEPFPFLRQTNDSLHDDESYQTPKPTYKRNLFVDAEEEQQTQYHDMSVPMEIDDCEINMYEPDECGVELDFFDDDDLLVLEELKEFKNLTI